MLYSSSGVIASDLWQLGPPAIESMVLDRILNDFVLRGARFGDVVALTASRRIHSFERRLNGSCFALLGLGRRFLGSPPLNPWF